MFGPHCTHFINTPPALHLIPEQSHGEPGLYTDDSIDQLGGLELPARLLRVVRHAEYVRGVVAGQGLHIGHDVGKLHVVLHWLVHLAT